MPLKKRKKIRIVAKNKNARTNRIVFFTVKRNSLWGFLWIGALIVLWIISVNIPVNSQMVQNIIQTGLDNALPFAAVKTELYTPRFEEIYSMYASVFGKVEKIKKTPAEEKETEKEPDKKIIQRENVTSGKVEIRNDTDYDVDTAGLLSEDISFTTSTPKVLIVHTHGSESYTPDEKYQYTHTGNYRTQNVAYNMIRVGEEMAKALSQQGISVIHDKTINDYPSYNASYSKTEAIIKKYTEQDKDIVFVFDLHRDAVETQDTIVKFASEIDGLPSAQVMMVCGTDTNLHNPHWRDNLRLAVHIQDYFVRNYPGFLRPLNLRKERFNMHLTSGSLLFEVGTNGNTLEEALNSAAILGKGIGEFIRNNGV